MEETKIEEVTDDVKVEVTDEEQEAFVKDTEDNTIDMSDDKEPEEEANND